MVNPCLQVPALKFLIAQTGKGLAKLLVRKQEHGVYHLVIDWNGGAERT
jgi:hypothetical protein